MSAVVAPRALPALALLGAAALLALRPLGAQEPPAPAPSAPAPSRPPPDDAALAAARADFLEVAKVLQSPRCQNCHPAGDRPLRGDKGEPHAMNVSRRSPPAGLSCTACHRERNAPMRGGPPGVHGWRMPPDQTPMVFERKTPGDLCRVLVDPAQNGNKGLQALHDHLDHDELVLWGWSPGPGRSLPPLTHADFMVRVRGWIGAGAPCPP